MQKRSARFTNGLSIIIFLLSVGIHPSPLTFDLYALLRARRWEEISNYFRIKKPVQKSEKYAMARAIVARYEERRKSSSRNKIPQPIIQGLRAYLNVLNLHCDRASNELSFLKCLGKTGVEKQQNLIEKLAIWRSGTLTKKYKMEKLSLRILMLADLTRREPLSQKIYSDRLSLLLRLKKNDEAKKLAERFRNLDGPVANLWRAKAKYRTGNKKDAFNHYILSALSTDVNWIIKSNVRDLKSGFRGIFHPASLSKNTKRNRSLLIFSPFLRKRELIALKSGVSPDNILRTTSPYRLTSDGVFFIKTGNLKYLKILADQNYTQISQSPEILFAWVTQLKSRKMNGMIVHLMNKFKHVKKQKAPLWIAYLNLLEKQKSKVYFREIIDYLNTFHADYEVHDRLIQYLIGAQSKRIEWSSLDDWKIAEHSLPRLTSRGRFQYWLLRYYMKKNNQKDTRQLKQTFYENAPGSYYSQSYWDIMPKGNYARAWRRVRNRKSYLRWVARHGGNNQAIAFLSRRNLYRYMDQRALSMWKNLARSDLKIPDELIQLYRMNELILANEYFDNYYKGKISRTETLTRKARIGKKSGNLFLSVYFTRQLARELKVAEDPFSMPPRLLRELYPRPYLKTVRKFSRNERIPEEMIYAIMRQESMFRENAISRSGARGLMQVMPRTGRWLARKMKIKKPDLMDPEISIRMGTRFFADLLRSNQQDFRWASIAYNGGPGNLMKWKRKYFQGDFNFFLENIPRAEPRNYCRITYQNFMHYIVTYTLYP